MSRVKSFDVQGLLLSAHYSSFKIRLFRRYFITCAVDYASVNINTPTTSLELFVGDD